MLKQNNNLIQLSTHPLYIKNKIKGKTLNLFGAPIPEETIILYYEQLGKYFIETNKPKNATIIRY